MKSILDNYSKLVELFQNIEEESSDSEVTTKVAGVLSKMHKHSFLFGECNVLIIYVLCIRL